MYTNKYSEDENLETILMPVFKVKLKAKVSAPKLVFLKLIGFIHAQINYKLSISVSFR